jgi:hypothetical protein
MRDRRRYSLSTELPLVLSLASCFFLPALQTWGARAYANGAQLVFIYLGMLLTFVAGWGWGWTSYRVLGRKRETVMLERRRQQAQASS